jgi:protocatechuate 3,4-dioxygenase, alpha subunit
LDADQKPVPDALIEIWQANACGKYAHPEDDQDKPIDSSFQGYGRIPADSNGCFTLTTVKPGRVPGPDGKYQAPHIDVSIFARGLLRRLVTRIYFADDPANNEDFVFSLVPAERRYTLLAKPEPDKREVLIFDIHLSGNNETVFFDV